MNWNYENGRIYSIDEKNELMAEATYVPVGNATVDINYTYVNPILRGQGVAGQMMEAVAQRLRKDGLRAVASCSYANAWLQKHRDSYPDVISGDLEG
ncbi:MAG: N-acetyltransferase [Clostridia bacterium]|nr:N-acetyltransferase [Clostridia bacterium]